MNYSVDRSTCTITTNAIWAIVDVQGAVGEEVADLQARVGGEPLAVGNILARLQAGLGITGRVYDDNDLANAGAGNVADLLKSADFRNKVSAHSKRLSYWLLSPGRR